MKDLTRWAVVSRDRALTASGHIEVLATAVTKDQAEAIRRLISPERGDLSRVRRNTAVVRKDSL